MNAEPDFRLVELLCSHLCHELISPVAAVNNGLELVGDGDPDIIEEAIGLIRQSAEQASRRLQFYRVAYGRAAGVDAGGGLAIACELAHALLQDSKIGLDWPEGELERTLPVTKQSVRLILNMIALAAEALPRGGRLSVRITGDPDAPQADVTATGTDAGLKEEVRAAMAETAQVESIDPRTIQAYFTARLAEGLGAGLAVDQTESDTARLSARLYTIA